MLPLLRACILVMVVQAAAGKPLVKKTADEKQIMGKVQESSMTPRSKALFQEVEDMARSGETPAFDKVSEIKRIVNEELFEDLRATHQIAVDSTTTHLDSIALCNAQALTRSIEIKESTEVSVSTARSSHALCRNVEENKTTIRDTECRELDDFLATIRVPAHVPTNRPRAGMVDYVNTSSHYFCPKGPEVTELDEECTTAEEERVMQKEICDRDQVTFESGFCTWRTELVDNCDAQTACYVRAETAYNTHVTTTTELVIKWKLEWKALKKIVCYTDVWLQDSDVNTADAGTFDACNALVPDTTPMDVDYGTPAAKAACPLTSVANYPGTSLFLLEYQSFSAFAEQPISCISAPTTTFMAAATLPPTTPPPMRDLQNPTTTTAAAPTGVLITDHGGWSFYKVPTFDTTDQGVSDACQHAGLVTPCAGNATCPYTALGVYYGHCEETSEIGCGNPMETTAAALGCPDGDPLGCTELEGVFAFMSHQWSLRDDGVTGGNACGATLRNWCIAGSTQRAGHAFCAKRTGTLLADTSATVDQPRLMRSLQISPSAELADVDAESSQLNKRIIRNVKAKRLSTDEDLENSVKETEVDADGTVRQEALRRKTTRAACSSHPYTAEMCPSGTLRENQEERLCVEDRCKDDAADDWFCCLPVQEDGLLAELPLSTSRLAEKAAKSYKRSDLESMEMNKLVELVKSLGANGAKAALTKSILKLQGAV